MSFGKPIVATRLKKSGVDWVNQDGVTGLNVPAKDPRALAQAIIRICSDRELMAGFRTIDLQRFRELFTIDRVVESVSGLYETVVKEGMSA
jgi:glycosyltransferase involved in cell wall biosynthesis